jgi:hypothetical protein
MPPDDDDKPDPRKFIWDVGDTETVIDRDADQLWSPQQAADWCDEIDELLEKSPTPHVWIDADVEDDELPRDADEDAEDGR